MIGSLPLGFAEPLVLIGLLTLPVLWWLLRLIPPRPRRIDFPPTRLLLAIMPREETPARTPWWLTLLRLALAALIIIAAAGPLWHPPLAATTSHAPIAMLIDDDWAAAATWDARMRTADDIIARAEEDRRAVALIPLSEGPHDISLEPAGSARVRLHQLTPVPHTLDRSEALSSIARFLSQASDADVIWLSDGVDVGRGADFIKALGQAVGRHPMTIVTGGIAGTRALTAADNAAGALTVKVLRVATGAPESGTVRALDLKGLPLGDAPFTFKAGDRETEARLELPVEIRNDIARIEIAGERSAGAVQLLDKRWRRRAVGIVSGAQADVAQPLLSSSYYVQRALAPFADTRLAQGESPAEAITHFLDQRLPMLILTDVGNVGDAHERLAQWIEDGGVLVRFAGPRLAASDDDLVPVKLRRGGRILGGSLSWDKPQPLAAFSREGPFAGMPVPNDVTVTRQVLAEPDATLSDNTWATLADGTPLVTAARRGKGLLVLFHVTGDTRWSDLPLSGSFVEMLKRIVALAGSAPAANGNGANAQARNSHELMPATHVLDGFGTFIAPPPTARPIPEDYAGSATAEHPPGFYGPPESLFAVNTLAAGDRLAPLDFSPLGNARHEIYRVSEPQDLRGPVFLAALALLLFDTIIVLFLGGGLQRLIPRASRAATTGMIAVAVLALSLVHAHAQKAVAASNVPQSALETKLAYVVTGNADVDNISKAGLAGLTLFLAQRTALEPGDPIGLDIARDELAFYPLIYWPIVPGAPVPSDAALKRIDTYMKDGGTVLFDTRDAVTAPVGPGGETRSPGMMELRKILSSLDIPELEPVPRDHVLTKTFYLLRNFPGRFDTGQLWVEALPASDIDDESSRRPARGGDGVSTILITTNDLAGAWATRPDGQPMLPMVDGEPRQREMAFRAGVNIVMYTLTGNYKADQVHVPALLERLGQ